MRIHADTLAKACADQGRDAAITIRTHLEPVRGRGTPVKPPTYAGGVFQVDQDP